MADNLIDKIKQGWANWQKVEPKPSEHKGDYFAHNWTPPKGRKEPPKPAKKVARKK